MTVEKIDQKHPTSIDNMAEAIYKAHQAVESIDAGPYEVVDKQTAYQVQKQVFLKKEAADEKIAGYKIGLASTVLQEVYHTDQPTYGMMTDKSVKNTLSLKDHVAPALEFEVFFIVNEDINGDDDVETIMAKCSVAPGFELPDGRFNNWFGGISLNTFIADASVAGAVCIGEPVQASYEDIDDNIGQVTFNGAPYKEGSTKKVLGHPVNPVKWLAQVLEADGGKLKAGQFVASGSVNTPSPIEAGEYVGTFEKIGRVTLKVTK